MSAQQDLSAEHPEHPDVSLSQRLLLSAPTLVVHVPSEGRDSQFVRPRRKNVQEPLPVTGGRVRHGKEDPSGAPGQVHG